MHLGASAQICNGLGFTPKALVLSALDFEQLDMETGKRLLRVLAPKSRTVISLAALSRRAVFRKKYSECYSMRKSFGVGRTERDIEYLNETFRHILGLV